MGISLIVKKPMEKHEIDERKNKKSELPEREGRKKDNKLIDDCFFFMQSVCKKTNCNYRHSTEAKNSKKICENWEKGKECTIDCPFMHSNFPAPRNKSDEFCFFETTEAGCTKSNCEFKHRRDSESLMNSNQEYDLDDNNIVNDSKPWLKESISFSDQTPSSKKQIDFNHVDPRPKKLHFDDVFIYNKSDLTDNQFYDEIKNERAKLNTKLKILETEINELDIIINRLNN